MDEPIAGALAKITKRGGKAIRALPEQGRQLVKSVPEPVQIQLARLSSRGGHVFREIFAGIFETKIKKTPSALSIAPRRTRTSV